jgi:rhodanese-related sulfurtransferase
MPPKPLRATDIRNRLEQGAVAQVLDVRGSSAYRRSNERVEGDLHVMPKEVRSIVDELDRGALILAYCTCQGDGLALRAAERLRALGFEQAHAVAEGLEGCRLAGLPVVSKVSEG